VESLIEEPGGRLLVYPGTGRLVADSSPPDRHSRVAEEMMMRTLNYARVAIGDARHVGPTSTAGQSALVERRRADVALPCIFRTRTVR
jgi:hypothetical protein